MGFNQGKFSNHKKINGTTMFAILFAMFLLVIGVVIGATYSGFQSTATSSGTLTFAVNGHQGTLNLTNTKVSGYNSQDLTLTFTLASEDNYHTPIITSIAMGGAPLNPLNNDFKSGDIIVATYSAPTLTINRAEVTGTLQITATSIADTYTISYNANGGTGTMANSTPSYGTDVTLSANSFTRDGYTFAGWATSVGGDVVHGSAAIVKDLGDTTLYAKWVANNYTISMSSNSTTYDYGKYNISTSAQSKALSVPTREGYTFAGWSVTRTGTYGGTIPSISNNVLTIPSNSFGDLTITANWSSAITYTISYELDGGEYGTYYPASGTYGSSITISHPTKAGYAFLGWDIVGMDNCTHTYGGETTIATTLSGVTATTFMNLRSTVGSIAFIAKYYQPLIFSSPDSFSIALYNTSYKGWSNIEYSTNLSVWNSWDGSEIVSSSIGGMHYIYMRGTGNNAITGSGNNYKWTFPTGANVSCGGNMMSLLDYTNPPTSIQNSYSFAYMFYGCNALISVSPSVLSAITLSESCYSYMFRDCSNLVTAPALPATTLASNCYSSMFYNCAALTSSPALPATVLQNSCYSNMFYNCTSLITALDLSATTTAEYSCYNMFYGCTSLAVAPALPATTLAGTCYCGMFWNCSSLIMAPELPATTLTEGCYMYMFSGCTSLTSIPELPATTLGTSCYDSMFSSCTNLVAVTLGADVTSIHSRMFYNCTNLASITLLKPNAPIVSLSNVNALPFSNSGFKVYVPNDLLATYKAGSFWYMYSNQIYAMPAYVIGNVTYSTLTEALAGAASGGTIYLRDNVTENISTAIEISKNITITSYSGIKQVDINFTNNASNLFVIHSPYTFTLSNVIFNNIPGATYYGRAVYINGGGTLVMNTGAAIQNFGYKIGSTATSGYAVDGGGGVYVCPLGTFNMNGGTIDNCGSYFSGGGVSVHGGWDENNTSRFNMSGGTISNCWCQENSGDSAGGGVYVDGFAVFTMSGGTICNNYSHMDGSGGVEVFEATFRMSGGYIYDNTSRNGGTDGVYLWCSDEEAYFYMTGGNVDQASFGWGCYLYYQPANANQIENLYMGNYSHSYNSAGISDWTGINNHTGSWTGTWDPSILNN